MVHFQAMKNGQATDLPFFHFLHHLPIIWNFWFLPKKEWILKMGLTWKRIMGTVAIEGFSLPEKVLWLGW